jgi:hypothetical protein
VKLGVPDVIAQQPQQQVSLVALAKLLAGSAACQAAGGAEPSHDGLGRVLDAAVSLGLLSGDRQGYWLTDVTRAYLLSVRAVAADADPVAHALCFPQRCSACSASLTAASYVDDVGEGCGSSRLRTWTTPCHQARPCCAAHCAVDKVHASSLLSQCHKQQGLYSARNYDSTHPERCQWRKSHVNHTVCPAPHNAGRGGLPCRLRAPLRHAVQALGGARDSSADRHQLLAVCLWTQQQ